LPALAVRGAIFAGVAIDVLVAAAFQPELAALRSELSDALRARIGGLDVVARAVGIGLPMSAVGAAMQLEEWRPRSVVLVGTCGAYEGSGVSLRDVVVARRVRLSDVGVASGLSQLPEPMSTSLDPEARMTEALERLGARAVHVATTLAVTVNDEAASRLAQSVGANVEHLEAYSVAAACAARGIPFAAVLGVANVVGSRAREQWRVHHRETAALAGGVVLRWLHAGAPR
jgi:futalosine hydrolase